MAALAAAQLLDELMGRNRNIAPNEKPQELNWEDPEYCKYFMAKFCPHDLFVNTRADLGACTRVHDEEAKKLFDQAKPTNDTKLQYQEDFLRFCMSMMAEVERRIIKGRQRLALNEKKMETLVTQTQTQKNQEQIDILNNKINELEAEAEEAGINGNVEQAQGLMKLCDQLKDDRDNLRKQIENFHWNSTAELAAQQEKPMEICEVCGAFLIVGDAQQRIDDHLMGKQHMGYARLRAAVEEVSASLKKIKEEMGFNRPGSIGGLGSRLDRERNRLERDRRWDREREHQREREKEREFRREKERERDRKEREKRSRTTEDERESYKVRDIRDRDRERESKDRERKHHSESGRHHHHHHRHHHRR